MSIAAISPDGVVYVYATFKVNKPDDDSPVYDEHHELKQLSWMQNNGYTHLIVRPEASEECVDWTEPGTVPGQARLWYVDTEALAMQRFWEIMNAVADYPDATIIAGWQLRNTLWPRLVTKGLRYGIRVDPTFRTDPLSKYSTIKVLLDVAEIYLQGAYPGLRALPSLTDMFSYMGVQQVTPAPFHVNPEELAEYTPEDWTGRGHLQVTNFLYGMQSLVRQYYT